MSSILLDYTTYLTSRSSILTGVGTIFDFAGTFQEYNTSKTESEADTKATFLDWLAVGEDLKNALHRFEDERQAVYESA